MSEITVSMVLAWWVSVTLVAIGTYLVFFSESNAPMVISLGTVEGLLGSILYLIIRQPVWAQAYVPELPNVLLPFAWGLLLILVVLTTLLLWRVTELEMPHKRVRELLTKLRRNGPRD